jgi:hypothetical protein
MVLMDAWILNLEKPNHPKNLKDQRFLTFSIQFRFLRFKSLNRIRQLKIKEIAKKDTF